LTTTTAKTKNKPQEENLLWGTISVVLQALLLALVLRTFLFQPFSIPSGSMKPNLLVGDYIFVSKFSYGISRHSFPFSPNLFSGRIWGSDPDRGDIVVFKFPPDTTKDYIKRLIGLPGDKVQLKDSVVFVNGKPFSRVAKGSFVEERDQNKIPTFTETADNGVSYTTMDIRPGNYADNTPVFTVPEGNYFFLGDNRDNSADSRFDVGMVPAVNLVGKAQIVFLSLKSSENGAPTPAWKIWTWPSKMRWSRIFTGL